MRGTRSRWIFLPLLWIAATNAAAQTAQSTERTRAALAAHMPAGRDSATDPMQAAQRARRPFRHAQHRSVQCESCHDMQARHGRVTIASPRDCDACHHRNATSETCSRCHETGAVLAREYPLGASMTVAGNERPRTLSFDHREHSDIPCAECHIGPTMGAAGAASCESCHQDHHQVNRNCIACHEEPGREAHDVNAHVTCTGAGCHGTAFLTGVPRTRSTCLACHEEQHDHRPGESCADCHVLPPFRDSVSTRSRL